MGLLMLKCPQTGREFSTSIHIDEASFKRLPDTLTKSVCLTAACCTDGGPVRLAPATTQSSQCDVPADASGPLW
jgi:hypothetical protein